MITVLILTGLLMQQPIHELFHLTADWKIVIGGTTYALPPLQQQPLPEVIVQANPPVHDLTLKDVFSILADYDVLHRDQQPFFQPAFGVTNFDSAPPAVWIFNTGDTDSKRSTVIHEFLHIYYHKLGLNPSEEFIRQEEDRLYAEIFGK